MSLRQRLVPYWLLGPGLLWLILFFVVPMYFMGELALRSGTLTTGFTFDWAWSNFPDSLSGHTEQIVPLLLLRRHGDAARPADRLPARLRDRLPRRPLQDAAAVRRDRALLHHLPDPHDRLEDDPQRLQPGGQRPADARRWCRPDGRVLATSGAVIAGLTYNFLPFMILPLYANLERLDLRLVEAAKDLYSSSRQAFLKVTLPLTMPGIVAGVLLTFIPAFGDYINAQLLGGTQQAMVGNVIQSLYLNQRDYPEAAALSFLMMALILADRHHLHPLRRHRRLHGRRRGGGEPDGGARAHAWAWLRRNALPIYAGLAVALHADPDRRHRRLLLRRDAARANSPSASTTASPPSTGAPPSRCPSSTKRSSPACGWRRSRPRSRPRSGP